MRLYLQICWVYAKTGFDKRRRWSKSFPLTNFSVKVVVVEAADFRHIFPDYSKYTALYSMLCNCLSVYGFSANVEMHSVLVPVYMYRRYGR